MKKRESLDNKSPNSIGYRSKTHETLRKESEMITKQFMELLHILQYRKNNIEKTKKYENKSVS